MMDNKNQSNDWSYLTFQDSIIDSGVSKKNQILSSEILTYGKYPVIDQGQDYISGYSNDEKRVFSPKQPVIIFGDHTRCLKYVEFPFIVGADGTKILMPDISKFNPKYLFFFLLNLRIPNRGYNRHYKLLKESKIVCPSFSEQDNISHILSAIQSKIETQEKIIKTTTELKKALMEKLFTEGLHDEKQKMTEIGLVPESWAIKKIEDIADVSSGGTPSRKRKDFWQNGNIPWVKTGEIKYSLIINTEEKITEKGLNNSSVKRYPAGTLLMAMYGQGVTRGRVAILGIEATINQACAAFTLKNEVCVEYLFYYFTFNYENIRNFGHGAHQKNLSGTVIKHISVPIPPLVDQKEIASIFMQLDKKLEVKIKRKELLQDVFNSMLSQLMTGAIRVDKLTF